MNEREIVVDCALEGNWRNYEDLLGVFTAMKAMEVTTLTITDETADFLEDKKYKVVYREIEEGKTAIIITLIEEETVEE
jgi:hypothetical protein